MRLRCLVDAILEEKRGHATGSKPFGGLGAFTIDNKKVKSATGRDDDGRAVRCSWIRSKDRQRRLGDVCDPRDSRHEGRDALFR
jgi:hypothetical protein